MIKRLIVFAIILIGVAVTVFLWFSPATNRFEKNELVKVNPDYDDDDTTQNKVQLKSAIITLRSTTPFMGSDIETRVYLDDYGNKYATITDTKLDYKGTPVVTTQISIISNGYVYNYDPEKKRGIKSINTDNFNPTKINFRKLDRSTMDGYGLKKEGHSTVLDKLCRVYSIDIPSMQMSGTYYVWQNITLRSKTKLDNVTMDMEAVKIQENVKIPPKFFEVPQNISFDEPTVDTTRHRLPSALKKP